jgi:hypothetical protein
MPCLMYCFVICLTSPKASVRRLGHATIEENHILDLPGQGCEDNEDRSEGNLSTGNLASLEAAKLRGRYAATNRPGNTQCH